jgi:hypothetical protein
MQVKVNYPLLLCAVSIIVCCTSCQPSTLPSPPEWRSLIPSRSTIDDVLKKWPDQHPTSDIINGTQRKVSFLEEFGSGFAPPYKEYRFWFEQDRLQVIDIQWSPPSLAEPGYQTLAAIVGKYGRPSIVTWSEKRRVRTAMWPEQGLMAHVRYGRAPQTTDPNAAEVWGIGFFEPISHESFESSLVRRLVPRENLFAPGVTDASDGAPEDPFDWNLLTPVSSTPTIQ